MIGATGAAFQMKYRPANFDVVPDAVTAAILEVLTAPKAERNSGARGAPRCREQRILVPRQNCILTPNCARRGEKNDWVWPNSAEWTLLWTL